MIYRPFTISIESISDAQNNLQSIGVDPKGIDIMKNKAIFYTIKIKNLTSPQANIIKQQLLASGADCATTRDTITSKAKLSDVIMFATVSQYQKLIESLKNNYFQLPQIAEEIQKLLGNIDSQPAPLRIGKKILNFRKKTYIMGILNITPDSFSDGGKYFDIDSAIKRAEELIKDGADIIDIGGESTRPESKTVSPKEELRRILPIVKYLAKKKNCLISIDTRKSLVAKECLKAGAHIINDISALRYDKNMAKVVAKYDAVAILMHMQGTPETMQKNPHYEDLFFEIIEYLEGSIDIAKKAGILTSRIILDPGFGFGKTLEHNLSLLKGLKTLKCLGYPILAGTSRKSMIGKVLGVSEDKRQFGSAATIVVAILNGANIIRVHDVKDLKQTSKMTDKILGRK